MSETVRVRFDIDVRGRIGGSFDMPRDKYETLFKKYEASRRDDEDITQELFDASGVNYWQFMNVEEVEILDLDCEECNAEYEASQQQSAILPSATNAVTGSASPQMQQPAAVDGTCQHEWVDGDNQYVSNASVCLKCKQIAATDALAGQQQENGNG